jgi:hypothetical protein
MFRYIARTWYEAKCTSELQSFLRITRPTASSFIRTFSQFIELHRSVQYSHFDAVARVCLWVLENHNKVTQSAPDFMGVQYVNTAFSFAVAYNLRYPAEPLTARFIHVLAEIKGEVENHPITASMATTTGIETARHKVEDEDAAYRDECTSIVRFLAQLTWPDMTRDAASNFVSSTHILHELRKNGLTPLAAVALLTTGMLKHRHQYSEAGEPEPNLQIAIALSRAIIQRHPDDPNVPVLRMCLDEIAA